MRDSSSFGAIQRDIVLKAGATRRLPLRRAGLALLRTDFGKAVKGARGDLGGQVHFSGSGDSVSIALIIQYLETLRTGTRPPDYARLLLLHDPGTDRTVLIPEEESTFCSCFQRGSRPDYSRQRLSAAQA